MQEILEKALEAVQAVADFQLKHFRSMPAGADNIKSLRETVSFVDVESEKILKDTLLPLIPEAGFYGEESGKTGSQDFVWIVDPLDGTTNFLAGNDHFCISVALVKNGKPILGIISKPASGETWHCIKGEGVYYNGSKTGKVSETLTEADALFVTGFPYRSPDVAPAFFSCAAEVLTLGRGIRRTGSAALDVSNISCGWMQGFWETDLQPYDIAAAMLFAEENGCTTTNHKGGEYNMFGDRLMVTALPAVHAALLAAIQKHYAADI